MNEFQNLLQDAQAILERVQNEGDAKEFNARIANLEEQVEAMTDRAARSRIKEAIKSMGSVDSVLRNHPADAEMRKHIAVPPIQKLVRAIQFEVYRTT